MELRRSVGGRLLGDIFFNGLLRFFGRFNGRLGLLGSGNGGIVVLKLVFREVYRVKQVGKGIGHVIGHGIAGMPDRLAVIVQVAF